MNNQLIILQSEKRWVLERILASIFFSIIVYVTYLFFTNTPLVYTEKYIKSLGSYFQLIIFCAVFGVYYSRQEHHHFNLQENKYRIFYTVGPIGFGSWREIDTLSYTAINFIVRRELFEVNIWDESNNRFKVSYHYNKEEAKETAKILAEKFNIDFYDKDEEK